MGDRRALLAALAGTLRSGRGIALDGRRLRRFRAPLVGGFLRGHADPARRRPRDPRVAERGKAAARVLVVERRRRHATEGVEVADGEGPAVLAVGSASWRVR